MFVRITRMVQIGIVFFLASCAAKPTSESQVVQVRALLHSADAAKKGEQRIERCMRLTGFRYYPQKFHGAEAVRTSFELDRTTLLRSGYGLANQMATDDTVDPNVAYLGSLSEPDKLKFAEVLSGKNPGEESGGCFLLAQGEPAEVAIIGRVAGGIHSIDEAFWRDADIRLSVTKWANCMATQGFPELRSPKDVASKLLSPYKTQLLAKFGTTNGNLALSPSALSTIRLQLLAYEKTVAVEDEKCVSPFRRTIQLRRDSISAAFASRNRSDLQAFIQLMKR